MAQQVGARLKGDNYQGRFFWYQAAQLLIRGSHVERVVLEHDSVSGVDDVVVYYNMPGIQDAGTLCTAAYFQVKYHVDQRNAYSSDALTDPAFINARVSLLKRFYDAFKGEHEKHPNILLGLVSNWSWRPDDPLATSIRDCNGALPDAFFSSGRRSALGQVREKWRASVSASEDDFERFARRLRLKCNYFSRGDLLSALSDRLHRAGLCPIDEAKQVVPYDDLALKFIVNGHTTFDAGSLRAVCVAEGLSVQDPAPRNARAIGIRSFMRFAEHLEDECESFVCIADCFDGRSIRNPQLWNDRVIPSLQQFLSIGELRRKEHHLILECHLSVSYAAGYMLNRTSGALVYPLQKGRNPAIWKPSACPPAKFAAPLWVSSRVETADATEAIVLAISVTHDVRGEVEYHLRDHGLSPRLFVDLRPHAGIGASNVMGADHAVALAEELQQIVGQERMRLGCRASVHLFAAAPSGFMFFLGQLGRALDPLTLYEFDFEGHSGYRESLSFPLVSERT